MYQEVDKSLYFFNLALVNGDTYVNMYRRIAFSGELIERRFYSVALKILETAMVLHTNEFKIYEQISKCYVLIANFKEALTILYKYLLMNPNCIEALIKIGIS